MSLALVCQICEFQIGNTIQNFNKDVYEFDTLFVEGYNSKLVRSLLDYKPRTSKQEKFKNRLEKAIECETQNFFIPKCDPSWNESKTKLRFIPGQKPAVVWQVRKMKKIIQEQNLRFGTKNEYIVYLGNLIYHLIEKNASEEEAWKQVCDDSKSLGHYANSESAIWKYENTGMRINCGKYDMCNTEKAFGLDDKKGVIYLTEGSCGMNSSMYPLGDMEEYKQDNEKIFYFATPWLVLKNPIKNI